MVCANLRARRIAARIIAQEPPRQPKTKNTFQTYKPTNNLQTPNHQSQNIHVSRQGLPPPSNNTSAALFFSPLPYRYAHQQQR